MVLKKDQERIKILLKDTITLLCKNGLTFKNEFSIEATIGITLDQDEVLLVSINEIIQSELNKAKLASVTQDEAENGRLGAESDEQQSSSPSSTSKHHRKRRRSKVAIQDVDYDDGESYEEDDFTQLSVSNHPEPPPKKAQRIKQEGSDAEDLVFVKQEMDADWSAITSESHTGLGNQGDRQESGAYTGDVGQENLDFLQGASLEPVSTHGGHLGTNVSQNTGLMSAESLPGPSQSQSRSLKVKRKDSESGSEHPTIIRNGTCFLCGISVSSMSSLERHIAVYHRGRGHVCHQCGFQAKTASQLSSHRVEKHDHFGREIGVLEESTIPLDMQVETPIDRQDDEETEENSKERQKSKITLPMCTVCNTTFTLKRSLIRHMNTYHTPGDHICARCGYHGSSEEDLLNHKVVKHRYNIATRRIRKKRTARGSNVGNKARGTSCALCDAKFVWKVSLRRHMDLYHGAGEGSRHLDGSQTQSAAGTLPRKESERRKKKVKKSRREDTLIVDEEEDLENQTVNDSKVSEENKPFTRTSGYPLRHRKKSEQYKWACPHCGTHFTHCSSMHRHVSVFHTPGDHICRRCGFHADSEAELRRHKKQKHNVKKYADEPSDEEDDGVDNLPGDAPSTSVMDDQQTGNNLKTHASVSEGNTHRAKDNGEEVKNTEEATDIGKEVNTKVSTKAGEQDESAEDVGKEVNSTEATIIEKEVNTKVTTKAGEQDEKSEEEFGKNDEATGQVRSSVEGDESMEVVTNFGEQDEHSEGGSEETDDSAEDVSDFEEEPESTEESTDVGQKVKNTNAATGVNRRRRYGQMSKEDSKLKRNLAQFNNLINSMTLVIPGREPGGSSDVARKDTFKCIVCDLIYNNKSGLKRHILVNHIPGDHICTRCGYHADTHEDLSTHRARKHVKKPSRLFVCEFCARTFKSRTGWRNHLDVHYQEKRAPYFCERCCKGYKDKMYYDGHMKSHEDTGVIYTCSKCSKTFNYKAHYCRHITSCHRKATCKCDECGAVLATPDNLRQHMRGVHNVVESFQCNCGQTFSWRSGYNRHKEKCRMSADTSVNVHTKQEPVQ